MSDAVRHWSDALRHCQVRHPDPCVMSAVKAPPKKGEPDPSPRAAPIPCPECRVLIPQSPARLITNPMVNPPKSNDHSKNGGIASVRGAMVVQLWGRCGPRQPQSAPTRTPGDPRGPVAPKRLSALLRIPPHVIADNGGRCYECVT